MKEKRTDERRQTFEYWATSDTETGKPVGRLVDINRDGLRLHCEQPVPVGTIFGLTIHLDKKIAGRSTLNVKVRTRWCRKFSSSQLYAAGFGIISPSAQFMAIEQKLVDYFSVPA